MRIDSHQHFWKYSPAEFGWINDDMKILRRDFSPPDNEKELRLAGFDGLIAVQARQHLDETRWLLKLAETNDVIKGVVGWVDLCSPFIEEQIKEFVSHKKFVGVRHIVQDEPDDQFMLRKQFLNGTDAVQRYDLSYDILIYPKQLRTAITFAKKYPQMRLVLDHCAKPEIKRQKISPWKEDLAELSQFQNVYCKVSGLVTEMDWSHWNSGELRPYLDTVFALFGAKRTMIGSDWPVCTLAGTYSTILSPVMEYIRQYSAEERELILGGNAVKAYQIQ